MPESVFTTPSAENQNLEGMEQAPPKPGMGSQARGDARIMQKELIKELKAWRNWYNRWGNWYGLIWNNLSILVIVLSALTSVLVATEFGKDRDTWQRIVLIALPAAASLFTTILIQFRVREAWQLRAMGRLDVEEIMIKAQALPVDDPVKFQSEAAALRKEVIGISRAQARQFFAYLAQKSDMGSHADPAQAGQQNPPEPGQNSEGATRGGRMSRKLRAEDLKEAVRSGIPVPERPVIKARPQQGRARRENGSDPGRETAARDPAADVRAELHRDISAGTGTNP